MKNSSVWNRKAQLGFGAAILTLLGSGVISYRALVVSNQSQGWVRHTDQVLEELQELLSAGQNIESSSRAFALTGDKSYIESFKGNILREARAEGSVGELTADNPVQQRRVPEGGVAIEEGRHVLVAEHQRILRRHSVRTEENQLA